MPVKRLLILTLSLMINSVFAKNTNVICPIPHEHMNSRYFEISASKNEAKARLKNGSTGFLWSVSIRTKSIVITQELIELYLRDNNTQLLAYEGNSLGSSKYNCRYFTPFTNTEFIAGSDGK